LKTGRYRRLLATEPPELTDCCTVRIRRRTCSPTVRPQHLVL